MSDALNEFAINLPMSTVGVAGSIGAETAAAPAPAPAPYDCTADVAVAADVKTDEYKHINVYVDSASAVNVEGPQVMVDVVLSVNITNPTTYACAQYKIVKRLSMDKVKLACQAEFLTPVSVVEQKTEEQVAAEKLAEAQEAAAVAAATRAKQLAGLI